MKLRCVKEHDDITVGKVYEGNFVYAPEAATYPLVALFNDVAEWAAYPVAFFVPEDYVAPASSKVCAECGNIAAAQCGFTGEEKCTTWLCKDHKHIHPPV